MTATNLITTNAAATDAPLLGVAAHIHAAKLAGFSMIQWRQDFEVACKAESSASMHIYELVLKAHGLVDLEAAREAILNSFAGAVHELNPGVTFEACLALKSVLNRTADAMAILKCKELPASLPRGLQGAAKACREANPKTPRKPRAGGKPQAVAKDKNRSQVSAVDLLAKALEALRSECGDNTNALEIVAELSDLATSLVEALMPDASEQLAA